MVSAKHSWIISLDNLSYVDQKLSDSLCRLSTGAGLAFRKNYTDDEEKIFKATRPIIINGIGETATESDLLDRMIIVELPVIEQEKRRTERDFWRQFEESRPRILGALFKAVSSALRRRDTVNLREHPRMADFAVWVTAAEESLGWQKGEFLEIYKQKIQQCRATALDHDPVGDAIRRLMRRSAQWEGRMSDLLDALDHEVEERTTRRRSWPGGPQVLSSRLKKLTPSLRAAGIEVEQGRNKNGSYVSLSKSKSDDGNDV